MPYHHLCCIVHNFFQLFPQPCTSHILTLFSALHLTSNLNLLYITSSHCLLRLALDPFSQHNLQLLSLAHNSLPLSLSLAPHTFKHSSQPGNANLLLLLLSCTLHIGTFSLNLHLAPSSIFLVCPYTFYSLLRLAQTCFSITTPLPPIHSSSFHSLLFFIYISQF